MRNFNQSGDFPYMSNKNSCCGNIDDRNMNFPNFNFTAKVNENPVLGVNSMDPNMMPFLGSNVNMLDMSLLDMNADVKNPEKNSELFDVYEGYMKGNMFKNMYVPYKNYRPIKVVPNSPQAESLLRVNELTFAAHEARLYLDVFPNDQQMIQTFNNFINASNQAIYEYEQKYGPLKWSSMSSANMFDWASTPWPWEMGVN